MDRRAVLGGAASLLAASAGCASVAGFGATFTLRAMRAPEASIEETETTCALSESFVASYPKLRDALREAANKPRGEWAKLPVSEAAGADIGDALSARCETAGGLYRFAEEWYFISVRFRDGEDAADHHGVGHDH
jgi:hypothetical protein